MTSFVDVPRGENFRATSYLASSFQGCYGALDKKFIARASSLHLLTNTSPCTDGSERIRKQSLKRLTDFYHFH